MAQALDLAGSTAVLSGGGVSGLGWIVAAGTGEANLKLNPQIEYTLVHLGLAVDGTTASTGDIFFRSTASVITTYAASLTNGDGTPSSDRIILQNGKVAVLGPGIALLYYKTSTGSPTFNILPSKPASIAY